MAAGRREQAETADEGAVDDDGDQPRVSGAEQGPPHAWLDVRRTDDDLRVHAGDGPGERSRGRVLRERRAREDYFPLCIRSFRNATTASLTCAGAPAAGPPGPAARPPRPPRPPGAAAAVAGTPIATSSGVRPLLSFRSSFAP